MKSKANKKIKVGVVGVGSLGQHHARIYSQMGNVELVGVLDVDLKKAAEVAAAHHTRAFDDLDTFAGLIEAAIVAVPTDRHFEISSKLMDKNLHLLVEKPIADKTDQAEARVAT